MRSFWGYLTILGLWFSSPAHAQFDDNASDLEKVARSFMAGKLKDPMSAVWEPAGKPLLSRDQSRPGYRVCYRINAKNSYGGYIGFKLHLFQIYQGRIIAHIGEDPTTSTAAIESEIISSLCAETMR